MVLFHSLQFYVVMATHEMGAFIHVFDGESKLIAESATFT